MLYMRIKRRRKNVCLERRKILKLILTLKKHSTRKNEIKFMEWIYVTCARNDDGLDVGLCGVLLFFGRWMCDLIGPDFGGFLNERVSSILEEEKLFF